TAEERRGSLGVADLAAELVDLVAEAGGVLEAELGRGLVHLLLEGLDEAGELLLRQRLELALHLVALALAAAVLAGQRGGAVGAQHREDVAHRLADGLRVDAVLRAVRHPALPAPLRRADRRGPRGRRLVGGPPALAGG